jgi:hypothetical protein
MKLDFPEPFGPISAMVVSLCFQISLPVFIEKKHREESFLLNLLLFTIAIFPDS